MIFDRFAWPWVLAIIAAVPVVMIVSALRSRRGRLLYPAAALTREAGVSLRSRMVWLPRALRGLALVLLLIALARPQDVEGLVRTTTEGIAMQLVFDRSGSMNEQITLDGRKITRLEAVKAVAAEFIEGNSDDLSGREGDMIGAIGFGSYADTISPLVREHKALLQMIGNLEISPLRADQGTAIGDAVALAAVRLREAEKEVARGIANAPDAKPSFTIKSKVVILLTDGVNNRGDIAPLEAAELCREWGIRLYTIGIAGEQSHRIGGMTFTSTPSVDARTMRAMADHTGGRFWLADSADALREIYAEIDSLEKTEIETSESVDYEERFPPFAAAALALLFAECLLASTLLRRSP